MENHLISKNRRLYKEGIEKGKSLRENAKLESHASFSVDKKRDEGIKLIEGQNETRIERLVPYRRGGMLESPFAFYRGAARVMAYDLKDTPVSGLNAQICGDAHLGNFGVYASPERQLVYDLNDFDETLNGPWEWDVKRLAASFAVAGFHFGLPKNDVYSICSLVTRYYRESMRNISKMISSDIWHSIIPFEKLIKKSDTKKNKKKVKQFGKKAKTKDHFHSFTKLTEIIDETMCIIHDPPYIIPARLLIKDHAEADVMDIIREQYKLYQNSLSDHILMFLNNFQLVDAALKVVGVGSIGTSCHAILLEHKTTANPFFLQIKQAQVSVLEEFLPRSRYDHPGRRVVEGQRLMQTVSDPFLGWSTGKVSGDHYYWRQLKDWKGSLSLENLSIAKLEKMAIIRGVTLAKSHARSADPIVISGYLGKKEKFDKAVSSFSIDYAIQNESDFKNYSEFIQDNKLPIEKNSK